ncbi:MAG TPA: class I SAM-dependent RNA methyltransferase [Clostridiaceae bacterium]|nr:class I SAM-dependent RNA methyltransferase [Clostridiaceae bacterium]
MKIVIPSLLGVEAVISREIQDLGYAKDNIEVRDGLVSLSVDETLEAVSEAVARLNINLRTGERVQLEIDSFTAKTFDELFDEVREVPWEAWIPEGWAFIVRGYSRKSELFGIPACQRTVKKGIVERLAATRGYTSDETIPEDPNLGTIRIQFSIMSDIVQLLIDTSGESLHKRGYRPNSNLAPLKETLAAAMLKIMRWEPFSDEALLDPFCGSGTIPIEAAMMAASMPPGINRRFTGEYWPVLDTEAFARAREEGRELMDVGSIDEPFIFASDVDMEAIDIATENAERAGIRSFISFSRRDVANIGGRDWMHAHPDFNRCLILGNPPYGERMGDIESVTKIHHHLAENYLPNGNLVPGIRLGIITAADHFESDMGRPADRRRKLYNGMKRCYFYQFYRHHSRGKNKRKRG